jgi:hypothetical protein
MPRFQSMFINSVSSGPFEGFFIGDAECQLGETNIAGVTIAGASIGLSVRRKATAVPIAGAKPHTVASASRRVL